MLKLSVALFFVTVFNCAFSDKTCPAIWAPLCANDGFTYPSKCLFDLAAEKEPGLKVVYTGECKDKREAPQVNEADDICAEFAEQIACTMEYMPVCGSNDKTYGNKCTFCGAVRQKEAEGSQLTLKHRGECMLDACSPMSKEGSCPRIYSPVCASDGQTYNNFCMLCADVFNRKEAGNLFVVNEGRCK